MIVRRSAALLLLLCPPLTLGYFTDVNNAHVELLLSNNNEVAAAVQQQQPNLHLEVLLQNKLWGTHTPTSILAEFESWIEKFERRYENLVEKGERLLVWLANHALIESHNAHPTASTFTLAHNEYSDMTFDEFQRHFNLHLKADISKKTKFNFAHDDNKAKAQQKLRGSTDDSSSAVSRRRQLKNEEGGIDWTAKGLMGPI
eukprot:scaffold95312_cov21-Cyclotella_meneghiniana.AAC.1